jgi:hypothetical protein
VLVSADQLVAHAVGDYVIQSDWMATEKVRRWAAALAHAATYSLPFLLLTRSPAALAFVAGTHAVVDRYRLARLPVWAKNQLAPARHRRPWRECSATGYPSDRPEWLAFWLLIIADNVMHVLANGAALRWLA